MEIYIKGVCLMVLKRVYELILSKSNSYNFYKNNYAKINSENEKLVEKISNLEEENKENRKEIERMTSLCEKYEKDNEYLESLLKFEIESIEKYMFELVELNRKDE